MEAVHINYLAVLVAAVVYYILGALWYSPVLFGKKWMKLINIPAEELSKGASKSYIISFIGALLMSYVMAFIIDFAHAVSFFRGMETGFWCWVGFVATTATATAMFSHKPTQRHLIDIGYPLFGFLITGGILAVWK